MTISTIIRELIGCAHRKTTLPITLKDKDGKQKPCYIACLECGVEIPYSWERMERISQED